MKIIKNLVCFIDEELEDAEKYAKKAMECKVEHPEVADVMDRLSKEEISHVKLLHDIAAKVIERYKSEHGDPPGEMMAIYNYEHEKQMHKAAIIKTLQASYKD